VQVIWRGSVILLSIINTKIDTAPIIKIIISAFIGLAFLSIVGPAQALLITDTYDPVDTEYKNNKDIYFTHNVTDGFNETDLDSFVFGTDTITSVTLTVYLQDSELNPSNETVTFWFDSIECCTEALTQNSVSTHDFTDGPLLTSVSFDGMLDVRLHTFGTWIFLSSTLAVEFDRLIVPSISEIVPSIPEPGTMGLFGIGLAGLGIISRRRRKKADVA
jgi:hypothetical protein